MSDANTDFKTLNVLRKSEFSAFYGTLLFTVLIHIPLFFTDSNFKNRNKLKENYRKYILYAQKLDDFSVNKIKNFENRPRRLEMAMGQRKKNAGDTSHIARSQCLDQ